MIGYCSTSQLRRNCILLATRNESIKDAAKARACARTISGLRYTRSIGGGADESSEPLAVCFEPVVDFGIAVFGYISRE
jgi:hypothetical protein